MCYLLKKWQAKTLEISSLNGVSISNKKASIAFRSLASRDRSIIIALCLRSYGHKEHMSSYLEGMELCHQNTFK